MWKLVQIHALTGEGNFLMAYNLFYLAS